MNKLKIVEFFNREYTGPRAKLIFMSVIGTFSFSMLVAVINEAAEMVTHADGGVELWLFFLYITVCLITLICRYYTLTRMTMMAEEVVRQVRVRLTDKIRHTELEFLERVDKGDIYARLAQDTDFISQSATDVMNVFETIFTSLFIYLYVAVLSPIGFVFSIAFMVSLGVIFFFNYRVIREELNSARFKEAAFFDSLNDTLAGFKEIKMNTKKNDALFADIENLSKDTEQLKVNAGLKNNRNIILAFLFYEGLLGVVVFGVPLFSDAHSEVVTKLVAAMMFVFGLLTTLSRGLPVLVATNVAVENLERLEARIDDFERYTAITAPDKPESFREIKLNSIVFRYFDKEGETLFTAGPIDLTIHQGDVLFIVGGNGSGKSTLLKLLTGLYYPVADDGFITLDGKQVVPATYQSYRELFSTIFTDFHLFKKLYGLESVDEEQVRHLIREMDIHKKTDYADGRFTNIDLSTGQRKRLAYISALLEERPICVFDEWAADQDPVFRRHFYERFLKDLKAMNKTIIAVTHDDKYFDKADRVIKMEEGKMME